MSGHSKWATTHRAKEVKDAKRGAAFTKLAAAITVAVRQGGGVGDPDQNFRLRLTIEKARSFNMPKENISRAIEKGMGGAGGQSLEDVMFEGFLPGGVAVMAEALTDNKLRTAQSVRMVLDKGGGTMAGSGAVGYLFSYLGELVVDLQGKPEEEAELLIIDMAVVDIESTGEGKLIVYCDKDKTFEIKGKIEAAGYVVELAELVMRPTSTVEIKEEEMRGRIEHLLEQLEEVEEVTHVWTNYA